MKARRQQVILELVSKERLSSQEEIRNRLADAGIEATQSTISRDIEELGLARLNDPGGLRYVAPGDVHQFRNSGKSALKFLCLVPNSASRLPATMCAPECGIERK